MIPPDIWDIFRMPSIHGVHNGRAAMVTVAISDEGAAGHGAVCVDMRTSNALLGATVVILAGL